MATLDDSGTQSPETTRTRRPTTSRVKLQRNPSAVETNRAQYCTLIKGCYREHEDSAPYYESLTRYINAATGSQGSRLQDPIVFDIRPETALTGESVRFPFQELKPGEEHLTSGTRLYVLEGLLCPDCICSLGCRYRIAPEFFIGHLDDRSRHTQPLQSFVVPNLPSARDNIIHVPYISLVRSLTENADMTGACAQKRREVADACVQHERNIFNERRYGSAWMRRVQLHTSQLCSIEQVISFAVIDSQEGERPTWHGLFLIDTGKKHLDIRDLPWSQYDDHGRPVGTIPLVPYSSRPESSTPNSISMCRASLDQFHPLKHVTVRDPVDMEFLTTDPMFIFASFVTMAMTSWNMTLNAVEQQIQACQTTLFLDVAVAMEHIRFASALIDRIEALLLDITHIIEAGGCRSWPKVQSPEAKQRKSELQTSLRDDAAMIRTRCAHLGYKARSAGQMFVSTAQMETAQKGITQAKAVHALTLLAFCFIPVSFVASLFGMNVEQLKDDPSIWIYFAVAAPISLLTLIIAKWEHVQKWWINLQIRRNKKRGDV